MIIVVLVPLCDVTSYSKRSSGCDGSGDVLLLPLHAGRH